MLACCGLKIFDAANARNFKTTFLTSKRRSCD